MRAAWRISLSLGAILLIAAGLYYISYGAIYSGTYAVQAGSAVCGVGCASTAYTDIPVTFTNYPIWNPPSWNHVDYSVTNCSIVATTYTPQNPPPTCLFPPAGGLSPDYTRNYGGAFLLIIGSVVALFALRGRESGVERRVPQ